VADLLLNIPTALVELSALTPELGALLIPDILWLKCETKSPSIRVHEARDRFIELISEDHIRRLASSYHNDDPCAFFKPPAWGSYNICFFVRFRLRSTNEASDPSGQSCEIGDRWVVRVPLSPYLGIAAYNKLESEVAIMQYAVDTDKTRAQTLTQFPAAKVIAVKTTIPIPKLYAYSLARENGPYGIASYMILEYIEGRNLNNVGFKTVTEDQRENLYV
jgi:hypothetical protein